MKHTFLFPGQGAQTPGMGSELVASRPVAEAVLAEVDEALGFRLSKLIAEGPAEELTLTANAQPAIMAVSIAGFRVLAEECGGDPLADAAFVAGHSLGEYSALVAAGSLELADCARLLRLRGGSMQKAVAAGEGAMVAALGGSIATMRQAVAGSDAVIANDNCPGQVVISGARGEVEKAVAKASELGVKRFVNLKVSVPFHCPLMAPVVETLREAMADIEFKPPKLPTISNVNALPQTEPETIKSLLAEQAAAPVRWRESLQTMASRGVERFFEVPPGSALSGLASRTLEKAETFAMNTMAEIAIVAENLKNG